MSYAKVGNNQFAVDDDLEPGFSNTIDDLDEHDFIVSDEPAASSASAAEPTRLIPEPSTNVNVANGVRLEQRRFTGGDTLDEPVLTTLMRDVKSVGVRLRQVVWRYNDESNDLNQEWDLWGPLVFCLMIATTMSMIAPQDQVSAVFSEVFSLIWIGELVVCLNIKLLGGSISFFHALCVAGYSLFPLVPASLFSSFVKKQYIRLIVDALLVTWAIFAATRGLKNSGVLPSRVILATYPVGLLFAGIGWLCVIA